MLKFKNESKISPEILVVTPLKIGDKISSETRKTIKRNTVPYDWIVYEGDNNRAKNLELAMLEYKELVKELPPFTFFLDSDIVLGRGCLDRLYNALIDSSSIYGYAYASFQYKGSVNATFQAIPFNYDRLKQHNYISSNSLFKTDYIDFVGLVTDDEMIRLLDWAFLLKMYNYGYIGLNVPVANFVAISKSGSISDGSDEDYNRKRDIVLERFVN